MTKLGRFLCRFGWHRWIEAPIAKWRYATITGHRCARCKTLHPSYGDLDFSEPPRLRPTLDNGKMMKPVYLREGVAE